jgi:hypothetical protein
VFHTAKDITVEQQQGNLHREDQPESGHNNDGFQETDPAPFTLTIAETWWNVGLSILVMIDKSLL